MNTKANIRYARALYALGEEYNLSDSIYGDMKMLMDVFFADRELRALMANPTIPNSIKKKALTLFFNGKVESLTLRFLHLLIDRNRETDTYWIAYQYMDIYRWNHNISRAKVRVAVPIDKQIREIFEKWLQDKVEGKVELSIKQNSDLIGGFTLRVGWRYIDQSLSWRMNTLKRELNKKI
ncbi:MAG: ATP synthase F1 subunit delta [Bacteroidales bacterium]